MTSPNRETEAQLAEYQVELRVPTREKASLRIKREERKKSTSQERAIAGNSNQEPIKIQKTTSDLEVQEANLNQEIVATETLNREVESVKNSHLETVRKETLSHAMEREGTSNHVMENEESSNRVMEKREISNHVMAKKETLNLEHSKKEAQEKPLQAKNEVI